MHLANLTSQEASAVSRDSVVVLPFGAFEQHGPHLPLLTDTIIAEHISSRLTECLPASTVVVPAVWLGSSHHHMEFAGSMTIRAETFLHAAQDMIVSIARHGFRRFLLLNAHGGNIALISTLTDILRYETNPGIRAVGVTYWHLIAGEIASIRDSPLGGMGHACELETSIMLACRPDLVHMEKIRVDGSAGSSAFCMKDMFAPALVSSARTYREITEEGGFGDPSTASAEKGQAIMKVVIEKLCLLVADIQADRI